MNFEDRHEKWSRVIQSKSESISQSLVRSDTCKVCTCLELLKLSLCPEHSHEVARQDFELMVSRLLGQVEESERNNLAFELSKHEGHLNLVEKLLDRLAEVQKQLAESERKIQTLEIEKNRLKRGAESGGDGAQLEELVQLISSLESRVHNYEESLADLKKRNEELNEQLRAATQRREDSQNQARIQTATLQNEFSQIKDEQQRLKVTCETLSKMIAESSSQLKLLREHADNRSGEEHMDQMYMRLKKENADFLEEQRRSQEVLSSLLSGIMTRYEELNRDLQSTSSQLEKLSVEQTSLKERQEECKTMSRHSNNLLSAADSVYTQHQELKDFQEIINQRIEEMRRDIEMLKSQKVDGDDARRAALPLARKEPQEEWYHPGSFEFVVAVGRKCWSCCQTTQESRGCRRK